MLTWLARYGGYILIAAGWLIFSLVIPSAAGPADALPRERAAAPAPVGQVRVTGGAPLLIGSSRGANTLLPPAAAPSRGPALPEPAPPAPVVEVPTLVEPAPAPPSPLPASDRLVIPRMGLDTKVIDVGVLPNGEMEAAAYAVGRLVMGVDAGEQGNVVLAGHNDVLGEVFRRLPEIQVGDEFTLYRGGTPFRYVVESRTIVREQGATEAQRRENARWMDDTEEPVATLISCYPYRVDTHRYIVRARLIE